MHNATARTPCVGGSQPASREHFCTLQKRLCCAWGWLCSCQPASQPTSMVIIDAGGNRLTVLTIRGVHGGADDASAMCYTLVARAKCQRDARVGCWMWDTRLASVGRFGGSNQVHRSAAPIWSSYCRAWMGSLLPNSVKVVTKVSVSGPLRLHTAPVDGKC